MKRYLKEFTTQSDYENLIELMGTPHIVYIEDLGGTIYVKEEHGPDLSNMLQATYNVTSGNPTQLYNIDPSEISKMYIDGEEVSPTAQYTFSTDGEHTVHYSFIDPTTITEHSFRLVNNLVSIIIPEGVTSIGEGAFYSCSLTSLTIPNSVTSIGSGAFSGLTSIVVEDKNTVYDSRNNCNAIIETASNMLLFGSQTTVIPNSVTSIADKAFSGCTGLTSIAIPEGVTSIGESAFYGCSGLTSVTIPNGVTSINAGTFSKCSSLTSVTIPNSVTGIFNNAFRWCDGLISVTIGNSVESIGTSAFSDCSKISSIRCSAMTAPTLKAYVFSQVASNGILYVSPDATGYDAWLSKLPSGWTIKYSDEL